MSSLDTLLEPILEDARRRVLDHADENCERPLDAETLHDRIQRALAVEIYFIRKIRDAYRLERDDLRTQLNLLQSRVQTHGGIPERAWPAGADGSPEDLDAARQWMSDEDERTQRELDKGRY